MIGVDRKVGGDEREFRIWGDVMAKKFSRLATAVVVEESGIADGS